MGFRCCTTWPGAKGQKRETTKTKPGIEPDFLLVARLFIKSGVYTCSRQPVLCMDLLRMVINERKKVNELPEAATIKPSIRSKGPLLGALVRIEDVLQRNERIIQRRENLTRAVVALALRVEVILDEVQRFRTKYNVMD